MAYLHISEMGHERDCDLKDMNDVGRSEANQVFLKDIDISRKHCQILHEASGWVLRDLNSRNGVYVNGARVTAHPLKEGDVIQIAKAVLTFHDRAMENASGEATGRSTRTKTNIKKIGEMCVAKGILSEHDLLAALEIQKQTRQKLGEIITQRGLVQPEKFIETLSEQLNTPWIDLNRYELNRDTLALFPRSKALQWCAIPIFYFRETKKLVVALSDPTNFQVIQEMEFFTYCNIEVMLAGKEEIQKAIQKHYPVTEAEDELSMQAMAQTGRITEVKEEVPEDAAEDRAISKLVAIILEEAVRAEASDIHIEPQREQVLIRYRIDGVLSEKKRIPKALQAPVLNRVKILAMMDIAEKRIPQDGRHTFKFENRDIDLRISSFPTVNGEKMVIRILNKDLAKTSVEDLGMGEEVRTQFLQLLKKPEGMLVVTGPTGSGKTSTLYASLNYVKGMEKNLVTLEDPVELEIEGVNQGQVYDHPGFTFASGLRAILRQDPNIILVGEIRDKETAQIAIQAALTGHLVLTTLHTNSAAATIPRMIDMGIEPYLITASLVGVLAQRLVRVICPSCRTLSMPPDEVLRSLFPNVDPSGIKLYKGAGCARCSNGYKGRTGAFELLTVDDEIQRLIARGAQTPEVRAKARERGMLSLRDDALRKALSGATTIDEVLRVTFVDV